VKAVTADSTAAKEVDRSAEVADMLRGRKAIEAADKIAALAADSDSTVAQAVDNTAVESKANPS